MVLPGITKEQMVEVDRIMMDELHIPIELMMENAGKSLAMLGGTLAGPGAVDSEKIFRVISGSGNNGGGGLVAARRLSSWGRKVEVYLPRGITSLRPVTLLQFERLSAMGVNVFEKLPMHDDDVVLIDAYLGYGYDTREDAISDEVFEYLSSHPSVISLDVPSGLDSNTGKCDSAIKPKATLTIAFVKRGLLKAESSSIGDLYVCDIGVPLEVYQSKLGIEWHPPLDKLGLYDLSSAFKMEPYVKVQVHSNNELGRYGWDAGF